MDDNRLAPAPLYPKRTIYGYPSCGGVLMKEANIVDMRSLLPRSFLFLPALIQYPGGRQVLCLDAEGWGDLMGERASIRGWIWSSLEWERECWYLGGRPMRWGLDVAVRE